MEGARALPSLTDGVVQLRPFSEQDAPALAAIWTDPEIRARNTVPEPSEDAAREWVARSAARAAAGDAWEWAVVAAASGELAGRFALKEIDWARRRAEAATWVAPRFRGRRFAARSLRLAAAHAFAHGMVRIHAECDTDNEASVRALLAAGMRHEGTLRAWFVPAEGDPLDQHVFGMLPADLAGAAAFPGPWQHPIRPPLGGGRARDS
ncbi:MAG: [ribosomal protein S5]-alanine N-acetyltransferase [Thermoleophilaceae bacterium]|nr:[ribosomal protein S5]-alanine N-acetyltransferase [Thermoleophilaceae bacterium]